MKKQIFFFLFLFFSFKIFAQVNLEDGLIIHYTFDEKALDISGNHLDGEIHGVTPTTGHSGKTNSAYYFNGSSYISMPQGVLGDANYTFSFWAKFTTLPEKGSASVLISVGNDGADQAIDMCNECPGGTGWNFISYTGISYVSEAMSQSDTWYHVVGTRDNRSVKFYINGKIIGGAGTNTLPVYGSPVVAYLGVRHNLTQYFNGVLDDFRYYDRAINSEEVSALYALQDTVLTGISNSDDFSNSLLFPNPSNGQFNLTLDHFSCEISIYNSTGELVGAPFIPSGNSIDLSFLSNGIYQLKLKTKEEILTQKLVIHKL